jgi:hypothetical protein
MRWRPFKLINASEQRWLAEATARTVGDWLATWLPGESAGPARCCAASERATTSLADDPMRWVGSTRPDGTYVAVAANGELWRAVAEKLFGTPADAAGPQAAGAKSIVDDVVAQSFGDLVQRLVSPAGAGTPAPSSWAPSADAWQRGSGAAIVEFPAWDGCLALLLSAPYAAHLLNRRERSRRSGAAPPIDRRQCIAAQTAQVRVWLGGASIELGVLQTLAVGDVVRLDARSDQPLPLTIEGQATGQRAFLGCLQGKRAAQLAQVRR